MSFGEMESSFSMYSGSEQSINSMSKSRESMESSLQNSLELDSSLPNSSELENSLKTSETMESAQDQSPRMSYCFDNDNTLTFDDDYLRHCELLRSDDNSVTNDENQNSDCDLLNGNLISPDKRYFTFTYTNQDIHSLAEQAEQMVLQTSFTSVESSCNASAEEEESDEENLITRIENIRTKPDLLSRQRQKERKMSSAMSLDLKDSSHSLSMDISSPESIRSLLVPSPDSMDGLNNSLGGPGSLDGINNSFGSPGSLDGLNNSAVTPGSLEEHVDSFSQPEGSRRLQVSPVKANLLSSFNSVSSVQDNSLDEVSSGEMEEYNRISDNDIWDQESFVSEYNYEESIDEERTRKLLNFGDDYRKFISSLSSSQSSLASRSLRRKRRKHRGAVRSMNSGSEAEYSSVYSVLEESGREYTNTEQRANHLQKNGFSTDGDQYNELLSVCGENIGLLVDLLDSVDTQDPFIYRRRGREIRILLNKWNKLKEKIQDGLHKSHLYSTIQGDIAQFRKDLTELTCRIEEPDTKDSEEDLENTLQTYKDAMVELSAFKNTLFQLNLSVHNLLAEVSSTLSLSSMSQEEELVDGRVAQVQGLQGDVVHLYRLWDNTHHNMASGLSKTQDSLTKLTSFEAELVELQTWLRKDAASLKKQRRWSSKHSSSTDSGISDSYDIYEGDLPAREEKLNRLRMIAKNLEEHLPLNSQSYQMISTTLESTSRQLNYLKKISKVNRDKAKQRPSDKVKSATTTTTAAAGRIVKSRRRRVARLAMLLNMLLMLVVFVAWAVTPTCCDSYTAFSWNPQLRYVNGPPPI